MANNNKSIRSVVIIGGGSAGWMTAAALANALQKDCNITLVESDAIGTVGVGEATIPPIKLFNQVLGISEAEFLRRTHGSFKLGIEFIDWAKKGRRYFHPFGPYGRNFDMVAVHQYWLQANAKSESSSIDDYSMAWAAARKNRFSPPQNDPRNVLSTYDYAYHFDAGLYAQLLREYSEARKVNRIEGTVTHVVTDNENGFIEHVILNDGTKVGGELFIDCSGFQSLLLGETLGVDFEDWTHWLPCNRAVAVQSEANSDLPPYTRSTAHSAGWQWQIPLQHRTGNGYVYCNHHISDDEATNTLMSNLDGTAVNDPRILKFRTGRRRSFWEKNVIAIGLASGFMEPLESTSLHLVQSAISRLLGLFPDKHFNPLVIQEYNRITTNEFERIRDFLILHYTLIQREDSEFWRYCSNMTIPDSLQYKIDHFKAFGRLVADQADLFSPSSWLAVHIGQLNWPEHTEPMLNYRTAGNENWLPKLREAMAAAAEKLPSHRQFIERHCRADSAPHLRT